MLIITRRLNETLTIHPSDGLDPNLTLPEAFQNGL